MLRISLDPQTAARVIAASRDTPDVLWIIKKSLQPLFFFFFWWTFKLVWWTSKGTCVILNYDFDSFYFSILMAGVRHPRIFHHKLREFNLEKQKMKRAFWKSRYLWLLKSTDAFVPRKELQLCLMSFFLNKCVYTFYALVPAWIKIISLSALNLTFFFFWWRLWLPSLSASSERGSEWCKWMKGTKLHNCVWLFKLCRSEGESQVVDFRKAIDFRCRRLRRSLRRDRISSRSEATTWCTVICPQVPPTDISGTE